MTTYVLYHDDADGYASALAAYLSLGDDATYIAVQYGQDFPIKDLRDHDFVYILDFSYPKEILEDIHSKVKQLVVIDHHETAMRQLDHLPYAIFDMTKSGARLSWEYFHPGLEVPEVILLVEDRDLWKFTLEDTKAFDAGMRATGKYTDIHFWAVVYVDTVLRNKIIEDGRLLVRDLESRVTSFVKNPSKYRVVDIDGHRVVVYNTTDNISELGNAFNTTLDIDYSISYFFTNKGELVLSYRGVKGRVHVGDICQKLGGGGHAAAAGVKLPIEAGLAWLNNIYWKPNLTTERIVGENDS